MCFGVLLLRSGFVFVIGFGMISLLDVLLCVLYGFGYGLGFGNEVCDFALVFVFL